MWKLAALVSMLLALGCGRSSGTKDLAPAAKSAAKVDLSARARAMLNNDGRLPGRATVIALSSRLSIAAGNQGAGKIEYLQLAAALRERVWRVEKRRSDVREAIELLGDVLRRAPGSLASCQADRRRARLSGEVAGDARLAYRELHLALERQRRVDKAKGRKPCLQALRAERAALEAFRPQGAAWRALEQESRKVSKEFHRPQAKAVEAVSSVPQPAAPSAPRPVAAGRDVVITPDPSLVSKKFARLQAVKPYSWPGAGRVVLSLSRPAMYQVGVLSPDPGSERGHRVYVDLLNTRVKKKRPSIESKGLIRSVRFGRRKGSTRVVVDLASRAYRRVFYLPNPFRVVIDLGTRKPPQHKPVAKGGKRPVRRITLDPGHGGWDTGAVGPTGLREKDVVLDVAHRAAPALANELGVETMLTRDTDVFVPLEERTARANSFNSDLFISIHCNATENGRAEGLEVFILDPSREMDAATMRAVARENAASHRHGARRRGHQRADLHVSSMALKLNLTHSALGSRSFAQLLRQATLGSLAERYGQVKDHGVKTAGFFVLLGAEMPATLFETAFISNPSDESRLSKADFRQKLADAIVNAVRAYRRGI